MILRHGAIHAAFVAVCLVAALWLAPGLYAFSPDTYAARSVLSSGRWVKIKVSNSGLHLITRDRLRQWGFSDPAKVAVYGYGGFPISDRLTLAGYTDDVPPALTEMTPEGIVFYAAAGMKWKADYNGRIDRERNYYSDEGYYFITETDLHPERTVATGLPGVDGEAATTFAAPLLHERELVSGGNTGHTLLGEDFSRNRSQTFSFALPDNAGGELWLNCAFATKTVGGSSSVRFSANGTALPVTEAAVIPSTPNDLESHYTLREIDATAEVAGERLDLTVTFTPEASVRLARLDYITVNYRRRLRLRDGYLSFSSSTPRMSLEGVGEGTLLWDVTDAASVKPIRYYADGSRALWTATESGRRDYVAWLPGAPLPAPEYVGEVTPQDLHGTSVPDMVIFTVSEFLPQARRLAELHRDNSDDPLDVNVVTDREVYNEFSSGTPDFGAMRRMLKMYYDRGGAKLRYALLLGRGIHDHRRLTSASAVDYPVLPLWQTVEGDNDYISYTGDDMLTLLADGAGAAPGRDRLCIAVGRIPATSPHEADAAVDKIAAYMSDKDNGDWKHHVVLAADDGDNGTHLLQMDSVYRAMRAGDSADRRLYTKVYVDAFNIVDRVARDARDRMFRRLRQGALWWWYTGHANTFSWTSEGLLDKADLDDPGFRYPPVLYAATCSFLHWDTPEISGAEQLFFNPDGVIAAVAATRPVYAARNLSLSLAVASLMSAAGHDGLSMPIGEILRQAKNTLLNNDTNKLRYVLLGDPALRVAEPKLHAVIDSIGGEVPDAEAPPVVGALSRVTVSGRVTDAAGATVRDFDGKLRATLYDAERSTAGQGHDGAPRLIFEEQGDRLYVCRTEVSGGTFSFDIAMPSDIAGNCRPPALSLYASAADGRDAAGVCRDFYVYGYDDSAAADREPPVITSFYLNSEAFRSGQAVNESPVVIATIADNVGINMSGAGIGHQLTLILDGSVRLPEPYMYYTPGDNPASGTLQYPLEGLSDGSHTLLLRVWDTSGNHSEAVIDFTVVRGLAPDLLDLRVDVNPAVDRVNFYISHDRPDSRVNVAITIYDVAGSLVWSTVQAGRSDMFTTAPVTWPLTDMAGRSVVGGIYICRASIACRDGSSSRAATCKIAVSPR